MPALNDPGNALLDSLAEISGQDTEEDAEEKRSARPTVEYLGRSKRQGVCDEMALAEGGVMFVHGSRGEMVLKIDRTFIRAEELQSLADFASGAKTGPGPYSDASEIDEADNRFLTEEEMEEVYDTNIRNRDLLDRIAIEVMKVLLNNGGRDADGNPINVPASSYALAREMIKARPA